MVVLCLAGALSHKIYAQQVVSGVVYDDKKITIPGVTVIAGNPPKALASTNGRGEFRVSVPEGTTLVFKFMGYNEKRVTLKPGQTTVSVVMEEDQNALEEVVVRGFVSRSKQLSTGSSFTISGEDIQDVPVANVEQLLQGKVPGFNVQINTGAPGFRGSTQIRGLSTISVSGSGGESFLQPTSPLYVIDGVPLDADGASDFGFQQQGPGVSPLSMIPQEDIASIEILKDAQATSLYGSMAAYGVIIITTKRGNSEIPRVRYTNNSFIKAPPGLRSTLGGNLERQLKIQQILVNAMGQLNIDQLTSTPFLSDSLNAYFNNSTDWQSLYYRTTFNQSHNVSIDGGNPTFNYKANLGYFSEKGVIRNTGFDRYTANLRMEYAPNEKFKFIGQVNAQIGKQSKGDGVGLLQTGVADGGSSSTLLPGPSFFLASSDFVSSLRTVNDNDVRVIRPVVEVSYNFLPGLRATTFFSYEFKSSNEDTFTPAAANNQFARVYAFNGRESNLYSRTNLTYAKTFGDDHNIFINAFSEVRKADRQNSITRQERTPNDQFQGPLGFDGYYSRGGGILTNFLDERAVSFALATSYDYQKKYVVDLSYRMDGSSGNGFDNTYSRNPAVGLRWNFSKEAFLENSEWLNLGALRLSWGVNVIPTGTLERIYGRYDITGNYNGQQGIGLNFDRIPNPNLKPTTTTQYNAGLDFTLFNNKIDVIYDTYYKKVDNLLFEEQLSNTTAFGELISNDAAIINYGHELSVTFRPLSAQSPFNWMITVNGAYNRDILAKLPSHYGGQFTRWEYDSGNRNTYLQHNVFRVGTPTLSNYLLINDGVYATDDDVPINPRTGLRYSVNGVPFRAGDPIIRDLNGDYILDANDYARTGNASPLFTGGFATNLSYKNFTINVNGSFTAKRTILNNALADRLNLMRNPYGLKAVVPLDDIDMWRQPGDIAKYPYAYDYNRIDVVSPYRYDQTLWAEDGTYLKINNIVLSYMFDRKLVRSWGFNNLRVYISMDNVHTFSSYSGPNPENVTSMGRDISEGYPVPRTYNVGCNIEF